MHSDNAMNLSVKDITKVVLLFICPSTSKISVSRTNYEIFYIFRTVLLRIILVGKQLNVQFLL